MKTKFRDLLFRIWYWYVSNIDKNAEVLFMNYGYADANNKLELNPVDEPNRYPIQLYNYLASAVDLTGKALVEVGSGRGGGLAFVAKNFGLKTTLGIDLNQRAVDFCNKHYTIDGISFMQGDAQNVNLANHSFDAVLNVESSHRYPNFQAFLGEVKRVLKPGGYFLFTDFRYDYEMDELQKDVDALGFTLLKHELITENVVHALDLDDARRRDLITRLAPKVVHSVALNFAGTKGSETYNQFVERKYEYFAYVFQAPGA